ncbi:hypothetical protein PRIPAC_87539 [Pristionchus pacificus]|uniref:Uncharacterized protein n=1 Tax=Pristionchus pacificus TaxID=54126 RepID=A0A2A6BZ69_PRIPA|nr:hypothetical protein PRIPAC_87539 [Pristionchus pacificus]|eukprot:PDM71190.1 hypothetical protein PRIPAC_43573 [Pristionchus pacificus]
MFSNMFGIFGRKADDTTTQESIQKLLDMEALLMKKQAYLEGKIKEEVVTAMKNGTQNKRLALQALNRKRQHQKGLEQVDNILSNLESQRYTFLMTNASKVLKAANNNVDANHVHDLMEDIAEQQEVANEIAETISRPMGLNSQIDDDDLLAELEALEQEELDKQLLDVHPIVSLPDVPFRKMPTTTTTETKDHDDLDALANWAMN